MLNRRLQRPVLVYTCQNVKLLEISCRGSFVKTTEAILMTSNYLCLIRYEIYKYISEQFRRNYDLVRGNIILFQQSLLADLFHGE